MPDFVPILIAAVLMLIALLIVFGGSMLIPTSPSGRATSKTIVLGQDLVVMYVEGQSNVTNLQGQVS